MLAWAFWTSLRFKFTRPTLPLRNECYLSIVPSRLLVTKLPLVYFPKHHNIHQNFMITLPTPQCLPRMLIVSVRDPGFKRLEVQMTSGFPAPLESWLQCLSVHYSSKLMMQGTTCCLQFSVWLERSWQKRLVFCEQHVINSLGACSLRVDDYSLWYISVYFWVHCTTSCAIFLPPLLLISALIEQKEQPFCVVGVKSNNLMTKNRAAGMGKKRSDHFQVYLVV